MPCACWPLPRKTLRGGTTKPMKAQALFIFHCREWARCSRCSRSPTCASWRSASAVRCTSSKLPLLDKHASLDPIPLQGMGALCLLANLRELALGFRCRFAPRRPSELSAALGLLTQLTRLEVGCPGTDLGPVPSILPSLTQLRHLRLQVRD